MCLNIYLQFLYIIGISWSSVFFSLTQMHGYYCYVILCLNQRQTCTLMCVLNHFFAVFFRKSLRLLVNMYLLCYSYTVALLLFLIEFRERYYFLFPTFSSKIVLSLKYIFLFNICNYYIQFTFFIRTSSLKQPKWRRSLTF